MQTTSKTRKAHYWNEDRFINGKDYFIVIDGATPLTNVHQFNEARWFVDYLKRNINRYKGRVNYKLSMLCCDAYNDLPIDNKSADYLPSASAAWVELDGSVCHIGVLGDCEVTAIYNNGEIKRFFDDRLINLDNKAKSELIEIARQKNLHIIQAKELIIPTLIKHRRLINKPDGYSALTIAPDYKTDERQFTIEKQGLKTIFIYSDGFSQAFESLKIYSCHEEMFKSIKDVDEEIKKIVRAAHSDKNLDLFPRFKRIDDITVTKIDF
ncbi:MAG: hypothetical protein ACI4MQ_02765 [Candidatus Coproplasma sp.]